MIAVLLPLQGAIHRDTKHLLDIHDIAKPSKNGSGQCQPEFFNTKKTYGGNGSGNTLWNVCQDTNLSDFRVGLGYSMCVAGFARKFCGFCSETSEPPKNQPVPAGVCKIWHDSQGMKMKPQTFGFWRWIVGAGLILAVEWTDRAPGLWVLKKCDAKGQSWSFLKGHKLRGIPAIFRHTQPCPSQGFQLGNVSAVRTTFRSQSAHGFSPCCHSPFAWSGVPGGLGSSSCGFNHLATIQLLVGALFFGKGSHIILGPFPEKGYLGYPKP